MELADLGVARDSRQQFWLYVRGAILLVVFAAAFVGLSSGVEVSERPGLLQTSVLTRLYYALTLFVLGGIDLGTPVGGPIWGQSVAWFAYFAAPIVTASTLLEGILRAINPDRWRLFGLRNHIIVGGCGRLTLIYLRRLREHRVRNPIVIVDDASNNLNQAIAKGHGVYWVTGNITHDDTLRTLKLEHAERALLFTGDDFVNLDAAARILEAAENLRGRVAVHVGDIYFKELMGNAVAADVYNIYEAAAVQLVDSELAPYFERTEFRDIVVFAGFGRLGHTILQELQRRAPKSIEAVIIIDHNVKERCLRFSEQVGFCDHYQVHQIEGDIKDLTVWQKAEALYDFESQTPAFLTISGLDILNLRIAMKLAQKYPSAHVLARSYFRSPFAESIADRYGFVTFSLAALIRDSLPANWFK